MQLAVVNGISKTQLVPVRWTTPRREMIDPSKEIEAQKTAVRAGFASWQETVRENGYNPEDVLDQLKKDKEAFDAAGLEPECDQRYDKDKGGMPPPPQKKNTKVENT